MKRLLLIACAVLSLAACKKGGASEIHAAAPDEVVIGASKAAEQTMKPMVQEDITGIADTVPLADRKRYFQQSQIYGFGELCKMGEPKVKAQDFVMKDQEAKKWTPAQIIFIATLMKMNQELMVKNLAGYECGPDVLRDLKPYYN